MAYYWVQQWFALPLIPEHPMGSESSTGGNSQFEPSSLAKGHKQNERVEETTPVQGPINTIVESVPTQSSQPFRPDEKSGVVAHIRQSQTPRGFLPQHDTPVNAFTTANLTSALPEQSRANVSVQRRSHYSQQQAHRAVAATLTPTMVYQIQQNSQFAGQTAAALQRSQPTDYNAMQPQLGQGIFGPQNQVTGGFEGMLGPHATPPSMNPHLYPAYNQSQHYTYFPAFYGNPLTVSSSTLPNPGPYQRRSSAPMNNEFYYPGSTTTNFYHSSSTVAMGKASGNDYRSPALTTSSTWHGPKITRHLSDSGLSSMPRGPPRKPKQSGHALWVGNLPPGTSIVDLKNHFSRDAMSDIESLFLISKSNCAFVNYKTEAACTAAMHRFHDSRFYGVRLVCRLRRSAVSSLGAPAAVSGTKSPIQSTETAQITDEANEAIGKVGSQAEKANKEDSSDPSVPVDKVGEKYFIVKSLTLQDLESSVQNGIWATQSHNEEKLNKAYHAADKVYLIFSANKSGEYFGYARMVSPILLDAEELQRKLPSPTSQLSTLEAPKAIPTPMTDTAPKGHIIDDSIRGTIFWEADRSESEENDDPKSGSNVDMVPEPDSDMPATWGKPFRVEWLSTTRLPFFRTRGLRNPWNANREVKIARDGTELETSVGQKLVQLFAAVG